ncbi:hypothetical protein FOYG_04227 [Fusarium oxysporum NRRL 32931]|uniref:Uncharacterized protein n=1 Tax=Fusarium oxysporum NRRL 32931 TaxID=660029 RepID=W9IKF1_FUSOX|nr:hypothetical protein FOYG_04227 [Fusarium oxysporum NRRL 32931]
MSSVLLSSTMYPTASSVAGAGSKLAKRRKSRTKKCESGEDQKSFKMEGPKHQSNTGVTDGQQHSTVVLPS